jgi:hypothetical protein
MLTRFSGLIEFLGVSHDYEEPDDAQFLIS